MLKPYLLESNIVCLLPETLTAHVDPVFADETSFVRAGTTRIVSFTQRSKPRDLSDHVPLTATLAVRAGTREPDRFVRHICCDLTKCDTAGFECALGYEVWSEEECWLHSNHEMICGRTNSFQYRPLDDGSFRDTLAPSLDIKVLKLPNARGRPQLSIRVTIDHAFN